MSPINKNVYSVNLFHQLDRFIDAIVTRKRTEMFRRIFETGTMRLDAISNVLDVGSTKDNVRPSSNYFARRLSEVARVTLFSDQPIDIGRDVDFTVEKAVVGDALSIDPEIGTFDLVLSSATIEHVGNADNQRQMIEGCIRAATKYVVITTPNSWHPIEFHTKLPLLHWLPRPLHRRILKLIGFLFFADEQNLSLLDAGNLKSLIESNGDRDRISSYRLETIRLLGLVSNLVFILELEQ